MTTSLNNNLLIHTNPIVSLSVSEISNSLDRFKDIAKQLTNSLSNISPAEKKDTVSGCIKTIQALYMDPKATGLSILNLFDEFNKFTRTEDHFPSALLEFSDGKKYRVSPGLRLALMKDSLCFKSKFRCAIQLIATTSHENKTNKRKRETDKDNFEPCKNPRINNENGATISSSYTEESDAYSIAISEGSCEQFSKLINIYYKGSHCGIPPAQETLESNLEDLRIGKKLGLYPSASIQAIIHKKTAVRHPEDILSLAKRIEKFIAEKWQTDKDSLLIAIRDNENAYDYFDHVPNEVIISIIKNLSSSTPLLSLKRVSIRFSKNINTLIARELNGRAFS